MTDALARRCAPGARARHLHPPRSSDAHPPILHRAPPFRAQAASLVIIPPYGPILAVQLIQRHLPLPPFSSQATPTNQGTVAHHKASEVASGGLLFASERLRSSAAVDHLILRPVAPWATTRILRGSAPAWNGHRREACVRIATTPSFVTDAASALEELGKEHEVVHPRRWCVTRVGPWP